MSGRGSVKMGDTYLEWNEQNGEIRIVPSALPDSSGYNPTLFMTYDQARELLDCLMVIFGRHELALRYPEVR